MKQRWKRISSLLLSVCMILTMLPETAFAGDAAGPALLGAMSTEQFDLTPGGTYYFDLSGQGIPGTLNTSLPDNSLKWVPFTYAGTVNAYSLTAGSSGDTAASGNAAASERSLFVAEDMTHLSVTWDELNSADLIFGKAYSSDGVSYTLRSLSMGSAGNGQSGADERGLPDTNEWDQILNKDGAYLKNWNLKFSWGQDTVSSNGLYRVIRGYTSANHWAFNAPWLNFPYIGFRPVLEIMNPAALGSDGLKTATYDMDGRGTLGSDSLMSATVVYTGSLTLPEITPANGFTYTGTGIGILGWSDGSTFYAPGTVLASLASGITLTAGYSGAAPSITTATLPGGTVGTVYNQTLMATGGMPVTWTLDSGSLPGGLHLSGNTISGTPTTAGTYNFTLKAINGTGSDTKGLSIVIDSASSNGGGYLPAPPTSNTSADKQPDMPTTAKMSVIGVVKKSILSAAITGQMTKGAIKAAEDAAKKSGKAADGISVEFDIIGSGRYASLKATIDAEAIERLKKAGVKYIKISSVVLDITFNTEAVAELDRQSTGTVTVTAKAQTKLSKAAKALIGSRPVFNITVSYQKKGKFKYISKFGKGVVTLGLAYKAEEKENSGSLFGVYVDKKGKPQFLTNSSYVGGRLIFSRDSLSTYGVGCKSPAPAFTDTRKHWAKDNIDFAVSRNLISGTSETTFAPETAITCADFLMALGRLSGADVSGYKSSSFTDVKNTDPAMPYIEWAVKSRIVQNTGGSRFGPALPIRRQDMAVMIQNYAKAIDYKLPVSVAAITFSDSGNVAAYARDAVKEIQQAGIMQSRENNIFDPQAEATRAEASTILRRFAELVIDEGTARGWNQNDSGQWKYFYSDGSLARNTKVDGYEVDENGVRKVQ